MRLQKYMMLCGVGSRRKCETYIEQGLVRVNGEIVTEMGTKVDPETDTVLYQDEPLVFEETFTIVLYKPHGYMCTNEDPEGRKTVQDLIQSIPVRMYHVGRLDYNTEGLLIMSNDGELANILMHPRYEIQKRYTVWCEGYISDDKIDELREGVMLEDGMTAPAKVHIKKRTDRETCLQLTIHEGRNRQVRRMIDAVGHSVFRLRRDRIGDIDLRGLNAGNWRYLSDEEVLSLKMV